MIDQAQWPGPCLDAWRLRKIVQLDDIAATTIYPEYAASALEHGICSSLSLHRSVRTRLGQEVGVRSLTTSASTRVPGP